MFQKRIQRTQSHTFSKFPLIVVCLLFWLLLGLLIFFVDPASIVDFIIPGSYSLFFVLLFMVFFLSFYLLTSSLRRGFFVALLVLCFALLRLWGVGSAFHLVLLLLLFVCLELAFTKT